MPDDTKPCSPQDHPPPVPIGHNSAVDIPRNMLSTAPLVKLEDEELDSDEKGTMMRLVAYSSSPSPLIEDRSKSSVGGGEVTMPDDVHFIRDHNEYSKREYAALEELNFTLEYQHSDMQKLNQILNNIIHGSSSQESQAISIEQLRDEAGHEGLRAKALKLDTIRPIIRGAGGLQFMMMQAQPVSSLIEEAGSLEKLRALVADGHRLRAYLHSFGGKKGLENLLSQVESLRKDQQELVELKVHIEKPDGLRAKAAKYCELQRVFSSIDADAANDTTQSRLWGAHQVNIGANTQVVSGNTGQQAPDRTVGMNPARARLLTTATTQDPNRDLYEPKPPVTNPYQRTGSNDVPLGPIRGGECSRDLDSKAPGKRRQDDGERVAKRPRVDVGRASALLQATLGPGNTRPARSTSNSHHVPVTSSACPLDYGEERLELSESKASDFQRFMQHVTSVQTNASHGPPSINRASVESLLEPVRQYNPPMIKQEDTSNDLSAPTLDGTTLATGNVEGYASTLIAGHPIALWTGGKKPDSYNPHDLVRAKDIPPRLADFLVAEITKHLTAPQLERLKMMPANPGTCILRNLLNNNKPSVVAQNLRPCKPCASGSANYPRRPCALLRNIDGIRTVVFLPLGEHDRVNVRWYQNQYWV